jgi:hypothetical protein
MSQRAKQLAERIRAFNNELMAFTEDCSEADWREVCAEDWTLGVVARHLGAGHYGVLDLVKMIVNGERLPDLSMDQLIQMANQHAREHAACTKTEVLDILRENGEAVVAYVAGLGDADLDTTSHLTMLGGEISTQQFIENVILHSGGEHFANMKAAKGA